ncbi:hypothetical protein N7468_005856 [Penicillium chermesinum]|uniref:Uncharacterized protein n=1 Tax=Penicillium chermesinum TaxID=63820 RepID=A0A9W9TND5_9EURO|nr:uncharacterized protein N7468_005856 [Penicillium chermesinum]KAJ5232900.1 hypothetical protein N7468_005856 [Penicillium chermesinum]
MGRNDRRHGGLPGQRWQLEVLGYARLQFEDSKTSCGTSRISQISQIHLQKQGTVAPSGPIGRSPTFLFCKLSNCDSLFKPMMSMLYSEPWSPCIWVAQVALHIRRDDLRKKEKDSVLHS